MNFLARPEGGRDGTTAHVYVVCSVRSWTAHGRTALCSWLRAGRTALRSWMRALRTCAPHGFLTTPPAAAVLRVRCLHSRLCCSRDLAIYRETFSDSPAALEDHLEEESGCDFVAVYIVFVLQDRCRREIEDSALVP